ncbi:MAG: hypothetical protein U0S48_19600 [Solirubrobacteraceae bacterium]
MRRKRSSRCSWARGTIITATSTNDGANRRNSSVVSAPNSGSVTNGTANSATSDSATPMASAAEMRLAQVAAL